VQDALREIRHDVTVEHTGDVVEDVAEEMRRRVPVACSDCGGDGGSNNVVSAGCRTLQLKLKGAGAVPPKLATRTALRRTVCR
jgi:hypothetical protein